MTTKDQSAPARVKGSPATLQQAHDLLRRTRPRGAQVSAERWRSYYDEAARIYATVAEIDTDHHHEALHYASVSREDAEKLCAATVPLAREEGSRGSDRNLSQHR
jgi:hypothetical protein